MNEDKLKDWMRRSIKRHGSQRGFSAAHGVNKSIVSLILSGDRSPSEEFAGQLGFAKVVSYRQIPKPSLPKPTSTEKE